MHIAIDLDDVVLEFTGGLRNAVYNEFGIQIKEHEINKWDLSDLLNPIIGRSWWSWLRDRDWLWANFPAVPGAIGHIEALRNEGHYLEILTSKPRWAEHSVYQWMGKWRPAVQRVTIVGPNDTKADWTNADVLIDDKPENLDSFMRATILFDRPHNQENTTHPRTYSWQEIHDMIKELSNGR